MRIRLFAWGLVCAASLCGQRRFNWQNYCFDHPAAPFCSGHEYAIKPPARGAAPRDVGANPSPSSLIVIGGIDWRFADPQADELAGFNFSGLSASPLAHGLIARLGASQGHTAADMQKIFDWLSGVDRVAISVRDNQIVVMVTGRVTDSTLPAETGLKAVPISGTAMLIGHADAVDQAVQRIAMKVPPGELARLVEQRQANSEFWAVGLAGALGPEAVSAGVKRFSLTVSMRYRFSSDMALEFNGAPSRDTLQTWQTMFGDATLEGNVVHARVSMEAEEAQQRFGEIAASAVGQRLAALVKAARYLPVRDATVPTGTRPVIYGLDSGPKEVNQYPKR